MQPCQFCCAMKTLHSWHVHEWKEAIQQEVSVSRRWGMPIKDRVTLNLAAVKQKDVLLLSLNFHQLNPAVCADPCFFVSWRGGCSLRWRVVWGDKAGKQGGCWTMVEMWSAEVMKLLVVFKEPKQVQLYGFKLRNKTWAGWFTWSAESCWFPFTAATNLTDYKNVEFKCAQWNLLSHIYTASTAFLCLFVPSSVCRQADRKTTQQHSCKYVLYQWFCAAPCSGQQLTSNQT